jgi:hypothetical protein
VITSVADSLRALIQPGAVAELRILNAGPKGTISGYFDNTAKMAAAADCWSGRVPAVYTTLNPVLPDLLARAKNRVIERARATTSDRDIVRRVWLPVDFDVTRPAGISSNGQEHEAALELARRGRQYLREQGWPDPIFADSGNGAHLDYRIDLPTESDLVRRVLEFLAGKLHEGGVHVDVGMHNPARIWKLYGTKVCKGDPTPERPHRVSSIIDLPEPLTIVSEEQMLALVSPEPSQQSKPGESASRFYDVRLEFNLDDWLDKYQHRLPPLGIKRPWNGGGWKREFKYCPWNPDHTNNSAYIAAQPSGAAVAGCHHNSCSTKGWEDLKAVVGDAHTGNHRANGKTNGSITGFQSVVSKTGEDWKDLLICPTKKDGTLGPPLPVLANAITALRHCPEWTSVLAYNSFAHRIEMPTKTPWGKLPSVNWTDVDDSLTCNWLQHKWIVVKSPNTAHDAVNVAAQDNSFNPLQDYLNNLDWDGVPRLERWLTTYLGVEDSAYARAVGSCWMISAVARAFRPGCQADYMLILESPQGLKKSTLIRLLAGDEYFTDHIATLTSKDALIDLQGVWIVELSEMDKVKGQMVETVKAFVTRRDDKFRSPYGRRSEPHPRTCVLIGTCNGAAQLTDETGARRFWPVKCGRIDLTLLSEHRDLLWAEAVQEYRNGARWYLETAELNTLAAEEQERRYVRGQWDDVIRVWLDEPTQRYEKDGQNSIPVEPFNSTRDRVTITDVLLHAVRMPLDRHSPQSQHSVGRFLRHEKWEPDRDWSRKETRGLRFYYRPTEAPEAPQGHQ